MELIGLGGEADRGDAFGLAKMRGIGLKLEKITRTRGGSGVSR